MAGLKMCPILTTFQILPVNIGITAVGEPAPGLQMSPQAGSVRSYQGYGVFEYDPNAKESEAARAKAKKSGEEPAAKTFPAQSLVVNCQGPNCAFWSAAQEDCKMVCGPDA